MTMPKFEPVAMIGGHGHPRHLSHLQSATEARLYGAMKPLYTADQLTEAYEAGAASRDAEVAKAFEAGRQAERLECLKEEYARGDTK